MELDKDKLVEAADNQTDEPFAPSVEPPLGEEEGSFSRVTPGSSSVADSSDDSSSDSSSSDSDNRESGSGSDSSSDSGSSSDSPSGSSFDSDSDSGSDEDESEEEARPRPTKRKVGTTDASKKKRFKFLDVEADVGSSDEEDEDFIDDDAAAREAREGGRESRELELLRREAEQRRKAGSGNRLQSVIQRLEERAARQPTAGGEGEEAAIVPVEEHGDFIDEGEFANAAAASMALFPTAEDFKLFFVRMAEPGKERDAVIQLSHKAAEELRDGKDCQIRSVFSIDSLRGYIYVEAPNDTVAKNFLMGIRKVQWYNLTVVPQSEMASVFKAAIEDSNEKFKQLQPGEFVRIKRHPVYKGDLARVVESYDRDVEVALVPRIDWFASRKDKSTNIPRSTQSLFDDRVIEGLGVGEVERLRNPSTGEVRNHYLNEIFSDDGFMIKRFSRQALLVGDDVKPRISELRWFPKEAEKKTESPRKKAGEDSALVPVVATQSGTETLSTQVAKKTSSKFSIGDTVRVISGDMKNLVGKIVLIDKSGVVSIDGGPDLPAIQVLIREIQKDFKLSDHVEIMEGPSAGDTGIITAITGSVCVILIDEELRDVKVAINSLNLSSDISKGEVRLGGYVLGQLVHFSKPIDSIGLIVRISKSGNFSILGLDGKRYSVTLGDITASKTGSKETMTVSRHGDQINRGTVVKYFDEKSQIKTGTVKEIYRNTVFVRENEKVEDSGFSVIDSKNVEVVSTSTSRAPALMTNIAGGGQPATQTSDKPTSNVAYRRPGQSRLEGKRVRIIKGQYKGQLAQVREDHDTRVQVSLEAKFRVVTIPKDCVRLEDEDIPEPDMNSGQPMGSLSQPPPGMTMGSLSQPPAGYVPPSSTPFTPAPPHLRGPN
jgi:transcription elongation factor SPT5